MQSGAPSVNNFNLTFLAAPNRYKISTSPNESMQVNNAKGIAYQRNFGNKELVATNSHLKKKAMRVLDERSLISRSYQEPAEGPSR